MTFDPHSYDTSQIENINAKASLLMKQGIRFMEAERQDTLVQALECFDQALELRRQLPDTDPLLRYGLAACWLNRADALVRLRDPARLTAALSSYNEAIAVLL